MVILFGSQLLSISKEDLDKVALSQREYELILQELGREPTDVELGMLGSLWSEHCGYKHSSPLLKLLPSKGKHVLVSPGEENAGVVDIGDGLAIVFKVESHNHPSAVEPYQGAATGVGGIVRDIFTMGARPIALLNSLRFGPLTEPRNRYLFNGIIGGIAGYGNCLGIPNIGGEVIFANCYSGNPLVNALCLGIARKTELVSSGASGEGNLLMLVGSDTGRDGIYGASGLASRTLGGDQELRPTVQVGNPFLEKLLIEACLELAQTDWIVGMQDLGAAGLTSSVVESAEKANMGVEIDVLKVPRREENMTPYEVMLSESQERMLVIVRKGNEDKVKTLLEKWDLRCDIIGRVTSDHLAVVKEGHAVVAQLPVNFLTSPPMYRRRSKRPPWLDQVQLLDLVSIPDVSSRQCNSVLLRLLAAPNIASKQMVYRQYDHQVMNNTVVPPGDDAAVLRIKGSGKGIAMTMDGNGRYCYLDPYLGGVISVVETARNLACTGAEPLAVTDCLNFGDPDKDDVYYQLSDSIRGIARACRELKVPVVSGNVSLYNEVQDQSIYPTPVIGMAGMITDVTKHCTMSFKDEGDLVFLLGDMIGDGLGGSEYLELIHGLVRGRPAIDLNLERRVQRSCVEAIQRGLVKSAHDCSDGGLIVTVAESCISGGIGFRGTRWRLKERRDSMLFGEFQSCILVSISPDLTPKLEKVVKRWRVPLAYLGEVGGSRLVVKGYVNLSLDNVEEKWRHGIASLLATQSSIDRTEK